MLFLYFYLSNAVKSRIHVINVSRKMVVASITFMSLLFLSTIASTTIQSNAFKVKEQCIVSSNCHDGGDVTAGDHPRHEDITAEALGFLRLPILANINNEMSYTDTVFQTISSHHVDDCNFKGATQLINNLYIRAMKDIDSRKPNYDDAPDAFGQLLHTVQDFYSHSNWIELGRNNTKTDLIDDSLSYWAVLNPYTIHKGVIVIQGKTIPPGYQITRNGKNIMVTTPSGNSVPGLISGVAYFNTQCPNNVALGHWDTSTGDKKSGEIGFGTGLNKDHGGTNGRPGYPQARAMAVAQTTHEWCRLVFIVSHDPTFGRQGHDILFSNWVDPAKMALANSACV